MPSSRNRKRKARSDFALLYGGELIAEGSESAMKRQKREMERYSSSPLSLVKKRPREPEHVQCIDVEAEALQQETKRLKIRQEQDAAFQRGLEEDRRIAERQRAGEDWKSFGQLSENRAAVYESLFCRAAASAKAEQFRSIVALL